jgi:uncharacterized protein
MKWKPGKPSKNVEDRRGESGGGGGMFPGGGGGGMGGGGLPIPMPGGKGGGGIVSIIIIVVLFFVIRSCGGGGDGGGGFGDILGDILTGGNGSAINVPADGTSTDAAPQGGDPNDKAFQFTTFVFDDVQAFWGPTLTQAGKPYSDATLVVFTEQVQSGCGAASAATGPFYCPLDNKAYMDLAFFKELEQRFGAPGDFAQAYVIAHEVGHHVQNQLGIEQKVRDESQANPDAANELSVRLELQADCFAGVWGRSTYDRGILEDGDLEEGLEAAGAVGDDRIAEKTGGRIDPENYTHGTAEQRAKWLRTGFDAGNLEACDTFSGDI